METRRDVSGRGYKLRLPVRMISYSADIPQRHLGPGFVVRALATTTIKYY